MRKTLLIILSLVLALSLFVGCTPKDTADEETGGGEDGEASDTVVVYTPHNAEVVNPIVKKFEEETGVKVDVVAAGTGELLKRVEAESDNPLGDVLWGGGAESLDSFKEYFEPYVSEEDDAIPEHFKDGDNAWNGFSALPMVIMYNKELVSEDEVPTSWEDLTDPKWKGQISFADPAKSGSAYTTLVTMLTAYEDDGEEGWDFIKKFIENLDGKIAAGSSNVYKGVADGEYALGLTLEEAAMRYVNAGAEVGLVYPEEGTSAVPDGIALIKGAQNTENAKKFIDFTLGEDVQTMVVDDFSRRSIRSDAGNPEGLGSMDEIKLVDYDFSWAAENKDEVLEKWKSIITGEE